MGEEYIDRLTITNRRNKKIYQLRLKGVSFAELGRIYGVSKQRIFEICKKELIKTKIIQK
jgi:Mor family transcriptional regulator